MPSYSRKFIAASLIYLLIGSTFGLIMAFLPSSIVAYRSMHAHFMMIGWVSMLMFAVGYHILPRFHARMLYSEKMATIHFWVANVGIIGMTACFWQGNYPAVGVFGLVQATGFIMFGYNIYKSITPFAGPPSGPPGGPPGGPVSPPRPPS